ncbi:MAG: DUF475 domain-containing protein [Patescibacteria group bacterium]|mgnify:CR=1 FL=1
MNNKSLIRFYGTSTAISLILIGLVGWKIGTSALILTLVLAALEITFSFDNAVINAKILKNMSTGWQQAFIWVGIPIAVFGVRVFLPLLIVSMIAGSSVVEITNMALNDPEQYAHLLDEAHYMISSFGGIFLLMLALDFFFENKKVRWLKGIESIMMKAGTMESLTVMIALLVLPFAASLVDPSHRIDVFTAGIVGMFVYLAIRAMNIVLARSGVNKTLTKGAKATFKAGLIGFIYLQVVDASFSLDSVIGAFAITKEILIIAVGLGIGAIYVRSMTIHMLRSNTLDNYRYMEHGAHYAIGLLAVIMILSLKYEIPEYITGLSGVVVITASIIHSVQEKRLKPISK